jgi:AcrR family transcriptional regulator
MPKSKQDWLKAGLKTIGEVGERGLTLEKLMGELGVTKGSFYHHFRNVEDYQERLIEFWADQYISTSLMVSDDPKELLSLLDVIMHEAFGSVTKPEIAIRAWAQQDERVRAAVEQVDAVRQKFVLKVFKSVASDERRAHLMTDMLSTMLIGSMTVLPRISPERVQDLYEEFKRLYSL